MENMCCDSPAMCEYIFAQKTFDVKVQLAGCGWVIAVYIFISMIYQQNIAKYILQYLMSKYSRPVVGGSFKVASCSTDVN